MLSQINRMRWFRRWPVKVGLFAIAVLAVCFPYPHLLVRHVARWSDPNQLIEPDAPALQPFLDEFRDQLTDDPPPREILRRVEAFVYEKIPYAWDWEVWGVADYIPTVTEAIEKGREDCDGRAVVAASMLTALGINAEIVTDFAHVWVRTDLGQLMGPGQTQAVIATEEGLRVNLKGLRVLPRSLAFGIAVFPFPRTLILTIVLWILLIDWRIAWLHKLIPLIFLILGLVTLRIAGQDYYAIRTWLQFCGLGLLLAGAMWAVVTTRRYRRNAQHVPTNKRHLPTDRASV